MKVLIDNGHGVETPGKRSPDNSLQEWKWTRCIAARIVEALRGYGIDAALLVPEDNDVTLRQRVARANRYGDALLVSIHVNASGIGQEWRQPHGWSVHVAQNAGLGSRLLATLVAECAEQKGLTVRKPKAGRNYWTQNLAICRDTRCTAILTENMFMDNRLDCTKLLTPEMQQTIVDIHTNAIIKYLC